MRHVDHCPVCGIELPSSDRGRPRTYCSRACRYRAAYMRDREQEPDGTYQHPVNAPIERPRIVGRGYVLQTTQGYEWYGGSGVARYRGNPRQTEA